jgi:hypothetical protein
MSRRARVFKTAGLLAVTGLGKMPIEKGIFTSS